MITLSALLVRRRSNFCAGLLRRRISSAKFEDAKFEGADACAKLYPAHVPTTPAQRLLLGVGSSAAALLDPWRADMVAVSVEAFFVLQGCHASKKWHRYNRCGLGPIGELSPTRVNNII